MQLQQGAATRSNHPLDNYPTAPKQPIDKDRGHDHQDDEGEAPERLHRARRLVTHGCGNEETQRHGKREEPTELADHRFANRLRPAQMPLAKTIRFAGLYDEFDADQN